MMKLADFNALLDWVPEKSVDIYIDMITDDRFPDEKTAIETAVLELLDCEVLSKWRGEENYRRGNIQKRILQLLSYVDPSELRETAARVSNGALEVLLNEYMSSKRFFAGRDSLGDHFQAAQYEMFDNETSIEKSMEFRMHRTRAFWPIVRTLSKKYGAGNIPHEPDSNALEWG